MCLRRLKALEGENAKLKKLLAEAMLDNAMLKMSHQKWYRPPPGARLRLIFEKHSR